jgi:16S rRNA (guanine527-N7)-methyltransferase
MFHVKQSEFLHASKQLIQQHSVELSHYADRLLWWNEKVNLVSRDVSRETIMSHIEHSLTLNKLLHPLSHWVDAGTGGGLPGIPLAIVNPELTFTLNDIIQKKCTVLKSIVRELGLSNVEVVEGSIADVQLDKKTGVCTKHAFKIPQLLDLIKGNSSLPDRILWLKGYEEAVQDIEKQSTKDTFEVLNLENNEDSFYRGKAIVSWASSE